MAVSPDAANISTGPGILWQAPLATVEPVDHAVVWPSGWVRIGYSAEGHQASIALTIANVEVAELFEPVKRVTTGRDIRVGFAMAEITLSKLKLGLNGGLVTPMAGAPSPGSWLEPPAVGAEVRTMLGWDSEDGQERIIWRKCIQAGTLTTPRRKGADFARFPVEFALETPAGGLAPFRHGFATARVA